MFDTLRLAIRNLYYIHILFFKYFCCYSSVTFVHKCGSWLIACRLAMLKTVDYFGLVVDSLNLCKVFNSY